MPTKQELIDGYIQIIEDRVAQGWKPYLVTMTFRPLPGSQRRILDQMLQDAERVYRRVLTRTVRNPRSDALYGKLPIWIVAPDYPVPKSAKKLLKDVVVNGGGHLHAMALDPPWSRLPDGLDEHFDDRQDLYVGPDYPLAQLQAKPIRTNLLYVGRYGFKAILRGLIDIEDLLLLPRSRTELSPRSNERKG